MSWFMDSPKKKGMTHSYVNFKSSHTSHRYESKTQEIVRFPAGMTTITDFEPSSPRKDFSNKPFLMPWGSFRDQPDQKGEGFSPKFRQEAVHGKETGSPRKDAYKANSPTARDHQLGKFSSFRSKGDDSESDDDDDYDYVCDDDGVCVRNSKKPVSKPNHLIDEGYARNNDKYRGNGYETNYEHAKPARQTYYDKSYDDLDLEKEKERAKFSAPKYTANNYSFPSNPPKPDTYYEKNPSYYNEKDQGKPKHHLAPGYTAPSSNQPKREPYYGTSYADHHTNEQEKENGKYQAGYSIAAPPSNQPKKDSYYDKAPTYYNDKRHENGYIPPYTVPVTTIPRKEQRYERSNSMPLVAHPPPIRTRVDRGRDADQYYNENGRNNSPHYNSPSRRDHQGYGDTVDDMDMRRRYGKPVPQIESYVEETKYAVIDAREAARRYNGILLTS